MCHPRYCIWWVASIIKLPWKEAEKICGASKIANTLSSLESLILTFLENIHNMSPFPPTPAGLCFPSSTPSTLNFNDPERGQDQEANLLWLAQSATRAHLPIKKNSNQVKKLIIGRSGTAKDWLTGMWIFLSRLNSWWWQCLRAFLPSQSGCISAGAKVECTKGFYFHPSHPQACLETANRQEEEPDSSVQFRRSHFGSFRLGCKVLGNRCLNVEEDSKCLISWAMTVS